MRICSVTLAGPGTEGIIGEALRSVVDVVDMCLIIDTSHIEKPYPLWDEVRDITDGKWGIYSLPWRDDFAWMRNSALDLAARGTYDWALMLDTDERMLCPDPQLLRDELAAQPHTVGTLLAWHIDGSYGKQRLFRLPRRGHYEGPTHEFWVNDPGYRPSWLGSLKFDEAAKPDDALRHKLERDVRILSEYVNEHDEARWWFYLGQSEEGLGIDPLARYERAVTTPGHSEIRGWAAFRAANTLIARGDAKRAKQIAMTGLMVYPHGPELFYIIAKACAELEQWHDAVAWAMHAGAAGQKGWGREVNRTGFIWPPAAWEAPFDLLARCYAKLGNKELARMADLQYKHAIKERAG